MKSLAEELGLNADGTAIEETLAETSQLLTLTGVKFAKAVLSSLEFRRYVVNGLISRTLPHQILTKLMDHGWGKVPDRLEVEDKTPAIDTMTAAQCEERLLLLAELARRMREQTSDSPSIH